MRRVVLWVVAVGLGIFAVAGLWHAAVSESPQSVQDTAREISTTLRCPTCAGESIADSSALLSDAMRRTVEEQVGQGRSPEEIRAWFAERYGDEVLLEPSRSGYGALAWAAPVVLVVAAATVLAVRRGPDRRRPAVLVAVLGTAALAGLWLFVPVGGGAGTGPVADPTPEGRPADPLTVLQDAVDHAPGDADLRLALAGALEQAGEPARAVEQYAALTRLRPLDPDTRYRHAFALVRDGHLEPARAVLDGTLSFAPDHAPTLLLLGALTRSVDPGQAEELLERFLAAEPDHPAAVQVAAYLEGDDDALSVEVSP